MQIAENPLAANDDLFLELTCTQLVAEQDPPTWLLPGMLQRHEPAVIVGPSKSMKTSLAVDLCGALASGGKFLGQFAAERAFRVGFVGGRAAQGALNNLAQRWSDSAGVDLLALKNLVWLLSVANLSDPASLQRIEDWIGRHQLEVVLIDVADLTTKSRRAQATQLQALVACCLKSGATPIVCCPTGKELKPRQLHVADLATAACHGLARQWLLVNRRQEYEPGTGRHSLWLTMGGNMVSGGIWEVDIDEGIGNATGRKWEVTIRSVESQSDRRSQPPQKKTERSPVHSVPAAHESERQVPFEKQTESSPQSTSLLRETESPFESLNTETLIAMYGDKPPPSPVHSPRKVRKRRVKTRKRRR